MFNLDYINQMFLCLREKLNVFRRSRRHVGTNLVIASNQPLLILILKNGKTIKFPHRVFILSHHAQTLKNGLQRVRNFTISRLIWESLQFLIVKKNSSKISNRSNLILILYLSFSKHQHNK